MGNLEHIDQLETYIKDLGEEIDKVKKASDYLKLIEQFQSDISKTSSTLDQAKDQLYLYQGILEGNLKIIQANSKNIELKQNTIENKQAELLTSLSELRQLHVKDMVVVNEGVKEVNNEVKRNHQSLASELKNWKEESGKRLEDLAKSNKNYFIVNLILGVVIVGLVLLM
jgi:hypothetical protein